MSPVPPPVGTIVPTDDWSDDPSFDLSSPTLPLSLALPPPSPSTSSSTSSPSHRSHHSAASARPHTSSPLRHPLKHPLPSNIDDGDEDGFDFDLPESKDFGTLKSPTPALRTSSATSSSSSIRNLSSIVIGAGPAGIGTITKLGGPSSRPTPLKGLPSGTVKARAKAIERAWEADLDLDDAMLDDDNVAAPVVSKVGTVKSLKARLTLSPPKPRIMPGPDALDDLGFDLDDDEATLKAGATIRAMLPPPRAKAGSGVTLRPKQPNQPEPDNLESDLVLPLSLTNLTLATQQPRHRGRPRPRDSTASSAASTWDSPGNRSSLGGGFSWEDSSPGAGKKGMSETSGTSISSGLGDAKAKGPGGEDDDMDGFEEEDMESGLVLPSPTFFSHKRAKELNHILDRKRKPQYAPSPSAGRIPQSQHRKQGTDDTWTTATADAESMEDGLVFDNPRVELSNSRLKTQKRVRGANQSFSGYVKRGMTVGGGGTSSTGGKDKDKDRVKMWEKSREMGWGRNSPLPPTLHPGHVASPTARDRTQSTLGLSGLRSHSASASTSLGGTLTKGARPESPLVVSPPPLGREANKPRSSLSGLAALSSFSAMPPPPVPSSRLDHPSTPASSSKLRHQKSHHHLSTTTTTTTPTIAPPPQSPSLVRKQSLASLQDAISHHHHHHHPHLATSASAGQVTPDEGTPRYHHSTSRLTMPTSSSRAKIRQPISAIFPTAPSSSSKRIPSGGSGGEVRTVEMPRRTKMWGDGTELEGIEDLVVPGIDGQRASLGRASGRSTADRGRLRGAESKQAQARDPPPSTLRKQSGGAASQTTTGGSKRTRGRKGAGLIKHLGGVDKKKVVGEMTWNPQTLRWEGNDSVLAAFDHISAPSSAAAPVRPALIAHYTGGSTASGISPSAAGGTGTAGGTVRIVGDMKFDPERMCWVSLDPEGEDDPFEGMADDEDEDLGGGTIRARKLVSVGGGGGGGGLQTSWNSRMTSESSASVMSWEDRMNPHPRTGGEADADADMMLWKECREAEDRHRKEMRGWVVGGSRSRAGGVFVESEREARERERREEKRLWEVRLLATRS